MSLRRLLSGWKKPSPTRARLRVTELEAREVPAVTIADITDQSLFTDRSLFLPVTVTNDPIDTVNTTVTSDDINLVAEVVTGGRSIRLTVSGKDSTGADFSGDLTLRLFENVAPLATGNIVSLINSGFYDGKLFHRIIDGFIIQGGSPNGDGLGGSSLPDVDDEFNRDYTFASGGLLAMANATDDNNNSQFFITDIDQALTNRPSYLNFNHTIAGILTSGFDIYQKIITTPVSGSSPLSQVRITSASVFTDTDNAVIKLSPKPGWDGTASVTVTAADNSASAPVQDTFAVSGVAYPNGPKSGTSTPNDNPFLNSIADPNTTTGTAVTVNVTATDLQNDPLTFTMIATGTNASKVTIDAASNSTGTFKVTPIAGFTGTVDLLVGVNDGGATDGQTITLTVSEATVTSTTTVTLSKTTTVASSPITIKAAVTGPTNARGSIEFFADGTSLGTTNVYDNQAAFVYTPTATGTDTITAKFVSSVANVTTSTSAGVDLGVTAGTAPRKFNASGAAQGSAATVSATSLGGTNLFSTTIFEGFTGGLRIAVGDVTNDGQDDIVAVAQDGGSSFVRVVDGGTGNIVFTRMMFEDTFRGGLYVDVGDFAGKGYAQILVGAGRLGGPRVTVWDAHLNQQVFNYFAYDQNLRGGVTVDAADLRGNGIFLIVTGAGQGGAPQVAVWDGQKAAVNQAASLYGRANANNNTTNLNGIGVIAGDAREDRTRAIQVTQQVGTDPSFSALLDPFTAGIFV
jgi:cyclophilin family peptidyl-prolyl cis-trans isomerase